LQQIEERYKEKRVRHTGERERMKAITMEKGIMRTRGIDRLKKEQTN
jgi:hypothetical protein